MKYDPPNALGSKGWRLFEAEYRKVAPIRYFIVNKVPNFFYPIKHRYIKLKDWFRYRTVHRYFMIDTGLSPGYYEIKDKVLHGPFNLLKNFVEKEQAWSHQCWSDTNPLTRKERLPYYYELFYRKPELGIKHFEWASTLDDPNLPPNDRCDHQAIAARETLELYRWWTVTRPGRKTDNDVTYDNQGLEMGPLDDDFDHTAPDYVAFLDWYAEEEKREEVWEQEDTEMLIRLIKLRQRLWT